jgi:predicted TIM-barrel fold metal-dependent hydrolase
MNIQTPVRPDSKSSGASRLGIVDCDIHPAVKKPADFSQYLPERWREHLKMFGSHIRQAYSGSQAYPRMSPDTARADAWPPGGGSPASDLDFMRLQHLDAHNIDYGILHPLRLSPYDQRNQEFGAALAVAVNEWQIHHWVEREKRLRASIMVAQDYPEEAVKEIERRAGDKRFVQVTFASHAIEPLGRRRYWPVFEAAEASGLPVGLHIGGVPGHPPTGGGWPSFYFEHHFFTVAAMQALVTSVVLEGVLERYPKLRIVLVETGFAWVPALGWRLDQHWERMRKEVPHLKRPPSEYIKEHFWFTTQPIEEPEQPQHLRDLIDWVGWDRIMFSTDYPHWDFDDPSYAFKINLTPAERKAIFRDNAASFYNLD